MRAKICCLLIATLTVSACSGWRDSNANPRNWFGGGAPAASAQSTAVPINPSDRQTGNPLINNEESATIVRGNTRAAPPNTGGIRALFRRNRQVPYDAALVDQVTDIDVNRIPTGMIVIATGEPLREGAFDIRLLRVNPDGAVNGILEYTINAYQPADFGRGTENTRLVQAAVFISNADLVDVREVRIQAARNSRSFRP